MTLVAFARVSGGVKYFQRVFFGSEILIAAIGKTVKL